jgi:hypothetical protein
MPARLPHELCLLILEYLSDEGLKSKCHFLAPALVCHAWTAHAQRQLFRVFSIRSPTLSAILRVVFLARNPRLASYVLEIRLYALHHSLDTTPAPLLAAVFPNVQRLTFCYALSGTDEAYQAMLSAFPAIKSLNIHSQGYVPATSAFLLPSRVGLASLKLRCCMESTHVLLHALEYTSSSSLHDISLGLGYHEPSFWWVKCVHELTSFTNLLYLHVRLSPYFYPRLLYKVTTRSGTLNRTLLMLRWEANELLW